MLVGLAEGRASMASSGLGIDGLGARRALLVGTSRGQGIDGLAEGKGGGEGRQ